MKITFHLPARRYSALDTGNRAAIYIRVSTEEQTLGHSLEAQESTLKEFAEKKGI